MTVDEPVGVPDESTKPNCVVFLDCFGAHATRNDDDNIAIACRLTSLCTNDVICPSCQFVAALSLAPSGKSPPLVSASPRSSRRGASRSSRTLVRAAMDAMVRETKRADADGEVVWA